MSLAGAAFFKNFSSLSLSSDQDKLMEIAKLVREKTEDVSELGEQLAEAQQAYSEARTMIPIYMSRGQGISNSMQMNQAMPDGTSNSQGTDMAMGQLGTAHDTEEMDRLSNTIAELFRRATTLVPFISMLKNQKRNAKREEEELLAEKNKLETMVKLDEENIKMAKTFEKQAVKQFGYS